MHVYMPKHTKPHIQIWYMIDQSLHPLTCAAGLCCFGSSLHPLTGAAGLCSVVGLAFTCQHVQLNYALSCVCPLH